MGIERRIGFFAPRRQREVLLSRVAFRSGALDQAGILKIAQQPAQIAGIEIERAADVGCGM